jgi:hypothetical protein
VASGQAPLLPGRGGRFGTRRTGQGAAELCPDAGLGRDVRVQGTSYSLPIIPCTIEPPEIQALDMTDSIIRIHELTLSCD